MVSLFYCLVVEVLQTQRQKYIWQKGHDILEQIFETFKKEKTRKWLKLTGLFVQFLKMTEDHKTQTQCAAQCCTKDKTGE